MTHSVEKTELSEIYEIRYNATGETNQRIIVSPEILVNGHVQYSLRAEIIGQLCERIIHEETCVGDR